MKALKEFQVQEEKSTISEIVGIENLDVTGFDFLNKPYCCFICKHPHGVYIKYEAPKTAIESLSNGYMLVIIDVDYVYDITEVKSNSVIEL